MHHPVKILQESKLPSVYLGQPISITSCQTDRVVPEFTKGEEVKLVGVKFKRIESQTLTFILEMMSWILHWRHQRCLAPSSGVPVLGWILGTIYSQEEW